MTTTTKDHVPGDFFDLTNKRERIFYNDFYGTTNGRWYLPHDSKVILDEYVDIGIVLAREQSIMSNDFHDYASLVILPDRVGWMWLIPR